MRRIKPRMATNQLFILTKLLFATFFSFYKGELLYCAWRAAYVLIPFSASSSYHSLLLFRYNAYCSLYFSSSIAHADMTLFVVLMRRLLSSTGPFRS